MRFVNMATTDSSGRFAFEDLEPKRYRVSFQKPAYQVETRELTAAEESDLRVELRRGRGHRASRPTTGSSRRRCAASSCARSTASGQAAFAGSVSLDSDGRGEVPSLKPGVYEVRAESSGYAPVSLPGVAVPSRTLTLAAHPGRLARDPGRASRRSPCRSPPRRLLGADGRVYMWSAFTTDGKIRLSGPVRRLENVAPGRYTFEVEGGVRRDVDGHRRRAARRWRCRERDRELTERFGRSGGPGRAETGQNDRTGSGQPKTEERTEPTENGANGPTE